MKKPRKDQTVKDFGEKNLIKLIIEKIGYWGEPPLNSSDDASSLPLFSTSNMKNPVLIINTDMLVGSTDVPNQMSYFQAGKKAIVMTLSDIYVKGCKPIAVQISIGVPENLKMFGEKSFESLIDGLVSACEEFNVKYLGGDLNSSPDLIVSVTAFGIGEKSNIIPRSGGKENDDIYTTGEYGLTGLGLIHFLTPDSLPLISNFNWSECENAVLNPKTDVQCAISLAKKKIVNASADSSDGLLRTVQEIAETSGTGFVLYWDQIPIADCVKKFSVLTGFDILSVVLEGGEEFNHVFTISRNYREIIDEKFGDRLTRIGCLVEKKMGQNVVSTEEIDKQQKIDITKLNGYLHFSK